MTQSILDAKTKKAIVRIAATLCDINQKLDYIISKQRKEFFNMDRPPGWAQ